MIPYVSKPYDPTDPITDEEARSYARSFHSNLVHVKNFFGQNAESCARKLAQKFLPEPDAVVVRGVGKYEGVFAVFKLDPIPYPKPRRHLQST